MYERYTDRARKVMQLANQEAQRFNHEYIGTEHILLGLVKEGSGVAANVLKNLDVDLRKIRLEVERIVQSGPDMVTIGSLPQTPRAKKVVEYSMEEARNLNHNYVGTEHLLLGLLREEEGVACQVLVNLGLQLEIVREEVLNLVAGAWSTAAVGERTNWDPDWVPGPPEPPREPPEIPGEVMRVIRELDAQIEQFNQGKEGAVADQDFEKAAWLRDQADKLKKRKTTLGRDWQTGYPVDPDWLAWNGGAVLYLAQAIQLEQHWPDLPILADALEEAGCTHAEMLDHCREGNAHGRSCWVVNLLLRGQ